jgi:hypothetical protein
MNPSSKETPQLTSVAPAERLATAGNDAEILPDASEQPAAGGEAALVTPSMTLPLPAATTPLATDSTSAAGSVGTSPPVADDGDLIEKEWVTKAKQIVERTRNDPYKQNEELTLFKADYMKKRYGKTIKVSQ